jgi:Zn-finger nucleic acid-binding protein
MKCPVCKETTLVMSDRQGIEIDFCPQCRGVWLDRGELDKIIERTIGSTQTPRDVGSEQHNVRDVSDEDHYHTQKRRKKRGFLGELFDFD